MAFLNDITLGQYFPVDSVVHRLDPRTKFLSVLVLMSAILVSRNFYFYGLFALFLGIVIAVSCLPPFYVLRNLRPFVWLVLLTVGLHALFTPGHSAGIPGLSRLTREGLTEGALFGGRLALLIVTASLLTLTTSPIDLTDGIERLLNPLRRFRVPAHELAMMMVIALRFIPLLIDEADRLRKAQMSRGAQFEGRLIQKIKSLIPLLVPLFLSAFRKADQLALAMEARSYRGGEGRTSYTELRFRWRDGLALGVVVGMLAVGMVV